jgi:hypothetical protein
MKNRVVLMSGALILLSLPFTAAISCTGKLVSSVDDSIVQIWESATATGGSSVLAAFGVIVGDGSQVLTVLNYESYTPDSLEVVLPGQDKYRASIEAIDPRTSATLLKLEGARLPVAVIGDSATIKQDQQVLIRGWSGPQLTFKKMPALIAIYKGTVPFFFNVYLTEEEGLRGEWVREQGAVVTDKKGSVLGLVGPVYSAFVITTGGPVGWIPPVVRIESAIGLLAPDVGSQPWTKGPAFSLITTKDSLTGRAPSQPPMGNFIEMTEDIQALLGTMGEPQPAGELPSDYRSISWSGPQSADGILLTVVYPRPVELRDTDGQLVAQAKWVGIQWGRSEGKPNRILYGSIATNLEGGFTLKGDINALSIAIGLTP